MTGNEIEFVKWLTHRQIDRQSVRLGIGDDMAVIDVIDRQILVSSDMLLDGVHFDTRRHDLRSIGRKAMACALSDCAAMAVRPVAATVSVASPDAMELADVQRTHEGLVAMADMFDVAIVGGDTTRWSNPLAIDVAVIASRYEGIKPRTRAGARIGDTLYVCGPLGGSLLGHHLTFTPRIREAEALARELGERLHAMMDISDGLSLDLFRMCEASGVGAVLNESLLAAVTSDAAVQAASADQSTALEHVLSDGEDFELLLAVADDAHRPAVPLFPIGTITETGLTMQRVDGSVQLLEPRGFLH